MAHTAPTTSTNNVAGLSTYVPTPTTSPLLTQFTPGPDCKTTWLSYPYIGSQRPSQADAIVPAFFYLGNGGRSCQLDNMTPVGGDYYFPVVYSPGVCPAGYIPASTISIGQFADATTSLCCPKGFTILSTGFWPGFCARTVTSSGMTVIQTTHDGTTTYTTVDSVFALELPYTVAWAEPELALFTPSGLPRLIAKESKPEGTSSTSQNYHSNPSHLSAATQAGIGVGAAAVGVAIGVLLMWFFFIRSRYRRRNKLLALEGKGRNLDDGPGVPELGSEGERSEVAAKEKAVEMYADVGYEFPQDWGQEADAGMRHELDGSHKGKMLMNISTPMDGDSPSWTEVIEKLRPIHHHDR